MLQGGALEQKMFHERCPGTFSVPRIVSKSVENKMQNESARSLEQNMFLGGGLGTKSVPQRVSWKKMFQGSFRNVLKTKRKMKVSGAWNKKCSKEGPWNRKCSTKGVLEHFLFQGSSRKVLKTTENEGSRSLEQKMFQGGGLGTKNIPRKVSWNTFCSKDRLEKY